MNENEILCGRYRLRQSIGRGGMADVYLAFDDKRQSPVAIKVLREDMAEDPDFARRFRREAQALERLDHPNIVRFYGFEQDGPVAFIIMDFIDGTTLRRHLQERHGPLEIKEITPILGELCSALYYAHLNNYVHRDLKPGNVMLKRDGTALLTDFGISRALEGATMTGSVMGTPAFMSPEQIAGRQVDARSDIYSLGVMLFEMAAGRRPFTGDEPGITTTGTTLRIQQAHLKLPPPDPRSLNTRLPAGTTPVILRCLAKDPADRWPDVMSLFHAWEAATGTSGAIAAAAPAVAAERPKTPPRQEPYVAERPRTPPRQEPYAEERPRTPPRQEPYVEERPRTPPRQEPYVAAERPRTPPRQEPYAEERPRTSSRSQPQAVKRRFPPWALALVGVLLVAAVALVLILASTTKDEVKVTPQAPTPAAAQETLPTGPTVTPAAPATQKGGGGVQVATRARPIADTPVGGAGTKPISTPTPKPYIAPSATQQPAPASTSTPASAGGPTVAPTRAPVRMPPPPTRPRGG